MTAVADSAAADSACVHCGTPLLFGALPSALAAGPFCCTGCRVVHALLTSQKLGRSYELRGARGVPVADRQPERRDYKWLEPLELRIHETAADFSRVDLDVQGLHCSACVWLIDTLFHRRAGAVRASVNPGVGRVSLVVSRDFDLHGFVREIEAFGYLFGPPLKREAAPSSGLVVRMGICIAFAMNSMIFGIAIYAGLGSGPLYELFQRLNLALSFGALLVGGSLFIRAAAQGLRRGVLHLDLPIALGIVLAFAGSVYSHVARRPGGIFVDTLNVFIALMLVGRYLQQRVLERNRLALLENDGAEGILTRRVRNGGVETVRCTELAAGDRLLVAPGDLVPVDAVLRAPAAFSLDWINGESRERVFARGARVPAGAFLAGRQAVELDACDDFAASPLLSWLRTPEARESERAAQTPWWSRLAKIYVGAVLFAGAAGFFGWLAATRDFARSAEVATAVLIVTCPCAFGIAMPLAYDLAQSGLRRAGLFVRAAGFLDRAAQVRTVVFDKTGTLTSGVLSVQNADALVKLEAPARDALYALASSSSHPKARAVHGALVEMGAASAEGAPSQVREEPGRGLSCTDAGGAEYRLGAPAWAAPGAAGDIAFGRNGKLLAAFTLDERLRPDAENEISELRARGYDIWLLSGDEPARAAQMARAAGIPEDHAVGGASPQAKAEWAAAHDRRDLMMIGDGINDSLAVERAFCSGTPAIDRPFMAARSDFYFVTPGLRPVRLALEAAKTLARVRKRNLALAVGYNVIAVSLAYAGLMSPLLCAVLMPASSLTTLAATTWSLHARSRLWRS